MTRSFRSALLTFALLCALPAGAVEAPRPDDGRIGAIRVRMDQARVFKLDAPASAIIIGNPAIADAAVHDGKTVIITGKSYGVTNIIIMDRKGVVVDERQIHVQPPEAAILSVQRGDNRETYSCTPDCNQSPQVGDTQKFFDTIIQQTNARNGQAQQQAGR